jgi:hypothetical protein
LLLDFDGGAYRSANRGDTVQVKAWADVSGITADDLKPYKTLVLDTAGRALDCLAADIIAGNPKLGRGGALTLQGFGELKARFIAFTKLIRSFGLDLVLLVHSDEQKNGDDIIERLDAQGGSKNEIYKVSDLMGRIKIEAGKRTLNFSPTDTAFGKNPAGFPKIRCPTSAAEPHFLGKVIADTKAALNKQTAEQKKVAEGAGAMVRACSRSCRKRRPTSTRRSRTIKTMMRPRRCATTPAACSSLGKEKGLVWDKNAKQFAAAVKVAA